MPPTGAAAAAAAAASVASGMSRVALTPAPPGALACQRDSSLRSLRTSVRACHERVVPATKKTKAQRFYELELHDTGAWTVTLLLWWFGYCGSRANDAGAL
jgi:hypothetical protein